MQEKIVPGSPEWHKLSPEERTRLRDEETENRRKKLEKKIDDAWKDPEAYLKKTHFPKFR